MRENATRLLLSSLLWAAVAGCDDSSDSPDTDLDAVPDPYSECVVAEQDLYLEHNRASGTRILVGSATQPTCILDPPVIVLDELPVNTTLTFMNMNVEQPTLHFEWQTSCDTPGEPAEPAAPADGNPPAFDGFIRGERIPAEMSGERDQIQVTLERGPQTTLDDQLRCYDIDFCETLMGEYCPLVTEASIDDPIMIDKPPTTGG